MNSENKNNTFKIKSALEMKNNLEKINNSFNNYIKSLIKDFDEEPETLKNSVKYSSELIDEFKKFYEDFNILNDEILSFKPNQNQQKNNSSTKEREKIVIDYLTVKELENSITEKNNKLKNANDDNEKKIKKYNEDLNNLPIFIKKQ